MLKYGIYVFQPHSNLMRLTAEASNLRDVKRIASQACAGSGFAFVQVYRDATGELVYEVKRP